MKSSDINFRITNTNSSNYKINKISGDEEELKEETKLVIHFKDFIKDIQILLI